MTRSTLAPLSLALTASIAAAVPSIRSLGTLGNPPSGGGWTNAVSSDGLTISGYGNTTIPPSGFLVTLGAVARLTPTFTGNYVALQPLSTVSTFNTSGFAYASSNAAAGRATVGTSTNASGISHATLWRSDNSLLDLVPLNQATYSAAFDITPDSHYAVGPIGIDPVRWTLTPTPSIRTMSRGTYAAAIPYGVSADAGLTAGRAYLQLAGASHAVRWRGDEPPESLGLLPGAVTAAAIAVSDNGGTIVGWNQDALNSTTFRGFLWRPPQGLTELATTAPGMICLANCVSADGSLVGGYQQATDADPRRPVLWNRPHNPRLLTDLLTSLGVSLQGWNLTQVRGISADGTIISGLGIYNGVSVSFLVILPPYCSADFNFDYTIDFFDYLDFVNDFADATIDADFNRDGIIDFFDYLDFVAAFNAAC